MSKRLTGKELEKALITPHLTIEEAVSHMHSEASLIVDSAGELIGMITDGDIRRAFLAGAGLKTPVSEIMTENPIRITNDYSEKKILEMMLEKSIRHLPVVNSENKPVGLELLKNKFHSEKARAVIMAGGKGTRLRPLTWNTPKPLLKIGGQTILDNILESMSHKGISDVCLTVNYKADQIRKHVGNGESHNLNVNYLEEEQQMGTAGGLAMIRPRPQKNFIVMNADLLTELDFRSLADFHRENNNDITVCVRRHIQKIPFGVINLNQENQEICSIDEKPDMEYLVNAGIYMLEPQVIDLIPNNQFYDMVSLVNSALSKKMKVGAFPVIEYWRDIGRPSEIHEARLESFAKKLSTNTIEHKEAI